MKVVKFQQKLVPLISSGKKNSTWRLYDDKNLSVGDEIELQEFGTKVSFGKAKILKVTEKFFKELTDEDKVGHEKFDSDKEMYETYSGYYNTLVGPKTKLKIIWFELLR